MLKKRRRQLLLNCPFLKMTSGARDKIFSELKLEELN